MAAESYKGTHGREQGFRLDNTRQGRQFLYNNAAPVARIPAIRAPDTGNRADSAERQGISCFIEFCVFINNLMCNKTD